MDKKKEKAEIPKKAVNDNKEKPQLKAKQEVFVSARNKTFFGCIKDTPIDDVEISDTHITFKMGTLSKKIDTEDLICVSSTPQSLQDQNCLSVFYKEYSDVKKTKFKIAEFKLACARSVSKQTMIEKLRLNVKNKFSFEHLKLAGEMPAEEYFKGLVNKPQLVYQGIQIIYLVFFYKNAMHFFSVFKKRFGKEKSVINAELGKLLNKQPDLDLNSNKNVTLEGLNDKRISNNDNNLIKLSSDSQNFEEFVKQKNLKNSDNEKYSDLKYNVNIRSSNGGVNDSNLFSNENIHMNNNNNNYEKNSAQCLSNNSRVKIYEKRDSREGFDDVLMPHDINFNMDSEHLKESESDFKKIIMKNHNENEDHKLNQSRNLNGGNSNIRENNPHNIRNSKDLISFKKKDMDPRSINDFDTFHVNKINKEEKNIKTNILDGQASPNPSNLDRKLSIERRDSFDRNMGKAIEDDYEIINPNSDMNNGNNVFHNNERMKIYKD